MSDLTRRGAPSWPLLAAVLILGLLAATPGTASAQDNRYATVGIENNTGGTIKYYFRWGQDAEWQLYEIDKRTQRVHYYEYPVLNQNSSPTPQIRFDIGVAVDPRIYKTYDLQAYASPDTNFRRSNQYFFDVTTIVTGDYAIEFYKKAR